METRLQKEHLFLAPLFRQSNLEAAEHGGRRPALPAVAGTWQCAAGQPQGGQESPQGLGQLLSVPGFSMPLGGVGLTAELEELESPDFPC